MATSRPVPAYEAARPAPTQDRAQSHVMMGPYLGRIDRFDDPGANLHFARSGARRRTRACHQGKDHRRRGHTSLLIVLLLLVETVRFRGPPSALFRRASAAAGPPRSRLSPNRNRAHDPRRRVCAIAARTPRGQRQAPAAWRHRVPDRRGRSSPARRRWPRRQQAACTTCCRPERRTMARAL
jgi:hypothetical protein